MKARREVGNSDELDSTSPIHNSGCRLRSDNYQPITKEEDGDEDGKSMKVVSDSFEGVLRIARCCPSEFVLGLYCDYPMRKARLIDTVTLHHLYDPNPMQIVYLIKLQYKRFF